ncbi:MAG: EamA family transporter [Elusimicrobia bacterium]|nr:EamA family transporter [Elusimicrobiota bacterium]
MSGGTVLLCLGVIVFWSLGPIFDKFALDRVDSRLWFTARFYGMFIVMLTPMVLQFDEIRVALARADRRVLGALGASVTVPLAGLYLYLRALGSAEASKVVPFCASFPLLTAALSVILLGEPVTTGKIAGTAMVVAGLWLIMGS